MTGHNGIVPRVHGTRMVHVRIILGNRLLKKLETLCVSKHKMLIFSPPKHLDDDGDWRCRLDRYNRLRVVWCPRAVPSYINFFLCPLRNSFHFWGRRKCKTPRGLQQQSGFSLPSADYLLCWLTRGRNRSTLPKSHLRQSD